MGAPPSSAAAPSESVGRIAAVAFLALLLLPVKSLLDSHPPTHRLVLVLAAVVAFFVVYLSRLVFTPIAARPSPSTWAWVGVALALTVALVVGDGAPRWSPLFIFVAAVVGVRLDLPWAAYGVAGCSIVALASLLPTAPVDNAFAIALQALALGALTAGMRRLRATVRELQDAREQLARLAVTEERLRIARDLHDLLGHSLSVIALKADLAGRLLPERADRAAKEVADIDAVARRALADVREAVTGYRQPTLAEAVETARLALEAAGIETTWDVAQVSFPAAVDVALGWAVREAVTNVIRHSHARRCTVRVTAGLTEAAVEVDDDGPSEDAAADGGQPPAAGGPGHGLTGLAERVAGLGGGVEAAPRAGGGFRLRASIPTAASLARAPR